MTCRVVRTHLTALAVGELDRRTEQEVQRHLEGCESCAEEALEVRRDTARIAEVLKTELMAPPSAMDRLHDQIVRPRRAVRRFPLRWAALAALAVATAALAAYTWPNHETHTPKPTTEQAMKCLLKPGPPAPALRKRSCE